MKQSFDTDSLLPWPLITVLAVALAVTIPFLFYGIPSGHDFEFHLNSWMEVVNQWHQGVPYPHWAALAHYGYGEARFLFYPPGSWLLGAILGAALPWSLVPAAYTVLVLTLCGSSMFLLARRWMPPRHAIFAAAFYAANPYHLVIVFWRSAYAELLAGALLPLLLLYALKADEEGYRALRPLSLVVAAVWLTNAPAAVMLNYSLVLIALVLSIYRRKWRTLAIAGIAIVLGAALAAFYIFPAAYEQKWVNIAEVLAPGVRPADNFLFTTISDPDHNRFNLLVSIVALVEMGVLLVVSVFSRKQFGSNRNRWWTLVAWSAAASVMMLSVTIPGWNYLPKLRFIQLPWRWLLCLNVALALQLTTAWPKWIARAGVSVLMLLVLIFVGHRVQPPWWDSSDDVHQLEQSVASGNGYEGTDEYVPQGADAYDVDPQARKATYESPGQARIHIYQWDAQSKLLSANVTAPGKLVMKLFNFPAWKVQVNSATIVAETREDTGQMIIPLQPGQNIIQITFTRTWDRTAGGIVSLAALALTFFLWWRQNRSRASILASQP
ncbi:MAG TPA: 6-pyruvoyl-tetrahydropterin synthase-related protein [Terriglobales bacterium]|nr:6-pyruvoyl-tetrahydropterin synthase-related protein [Terriglobales bacterium]